jgi:hypothetical protein
MPNSELWRTCDDPPHSRTETLAQLLLKPKYKQLRSLCAFFWVIHGSLTFICQRFGTLFLFHIHRRVGSKNIFNETKLNYKFKKQFFVISNILT